VLEDIRKREESALPTLNVDDFLHAWSVVFAAVDGADPGVDLVRDVVRDIEVGFLTEGEAAFGNVCARVVV
jgi:hypothetical protein